MALRFLLALSLLHSVWALWPIPATLSTGNTALVLSSNFYFDVAVQNAPADLHNAVQQAQYYLKNNKLGCLVISRGANDSAVLTNAKSLPSLKLTLSSGATVNPIATESVKPLGMRSEEYVLTVPADGSPATLSANSTLGLYRGLTMFGQMWYYYGGKTYTLEAPISITDVPAYLVFSRWMWHNIGLSNFPVADLQRTLDAMSWVKINIFHWHITDNQSFPLEVAQFSQLATNGAYSADETYSESNVQNLVQYAAEVRFIEIDTPGHTAIIGTTYPEYVTCMDASPWSTYANEPLAGQLRFALPEVVNFITALLSSVAKTLPSYYFSTGGDELNTNCYINDTLTQQQLKSANTTLAGALATFTNSMHSALIAEGKTPVVWEEQDLDLIRRCSCCGQLGISHRSRTSNYFYLVRMLSFFSIHPFLIPII
ncbi:glycoside hydrolase superfamily [Boletus reticuloceps]|uniref:beta-N-acetylhexosaminidase n=1 Tax=Boletus reticuloceps TaxID=495285 RepID=A0A8I2YPV0_9AGAM|nr:glycoside hydrolase superfamily [Boletus reticuloceps]